MQAQEEDDEIGPIIQWRKESEIRPSKEKVSQYSETTKLYWAQWASLRIRNGLLYREWETPSGECKIFQLVLPKQLRNYVLHSLHGTPTGGHFGIAKMLDKVRGSVLLGPVSKRRGGLV